MDSSSVIWKYELPVTDGPIKLSIPGYLRIISIGEQDGKLFVWVWKLTSSNDCHQVIFYVFGTGNQILVPNILPVGSVQMSCGLVWHVFKSIGD